MGLGGKRVDRLNSLLQEVISEVVQNEVKDPHLPDLVSITKVEITKDLRHAKVFVSVIGDEEVQKRAVEVLQNASGFIAVRASKEVVMRYFPELRFYIDDSLTKQLQIESLLEDLQAERKNRPPQDDDEGSDDA